MTSVSLLAGPANWTMAAMETIADPEMLLGPIDSIWVVRDPLNARIIDAHWQHVGDAELPAGTRLRYAEFSSLFSPCFGYDWAWHFLLCLFGHAPHRSGACRAGAVGT
jgi:hypothetical protein